jgi:hypothetical protein
LDWALRSAASLRVLLMVPSPLVATLELQLLKVIDCLFVGSSLQRALSLSRTLLQDVQQDVLSIPACELNADFQRMSSSNRSTIGVMLSGCKVQYTDAAH